MRVLVLFSASFLNLFFQARSASLLSRTLVCANDGITKAGTLFNRREVALSPVNPQPRAPIPLPPSPLIWCGIGTTTYLIIDYYNEFPEGSPTSPIILSVLRDAIVSINDYIQQHGDGLIAGGQYKFADYGTSWLSVNAGNHQQTWGVLRTAIEAFAHYMITYSTYGSAGFQIFDGRNQVAYGTLYAVA
ncbi:MAG: hypothetical protein FRX48_06033 [Lasallia pustulata]|uniref:Uncharacterized protein n=1 Tax=Lasallia pustulata TaxID=136370 RepID=A0A5M8PM90_9LECA|nr:MAG: hypothetical protein FRX48_06033 [Lasallia pustulata]